MSGWSAITVEPGCTNETNFPTFPEVQDLGNCVESALAAREEKSANDLNDCLEKLAEDAERLANKTGDVDEEQRVIDFIEANYELRGESPLLPRSPPTFQPGYRGLAGNEDDARQYAEDIFEGCDYAKRVLIISANDTSDSGSGILFERAESDATRAEKVDFKRGYEGARGRDVTGYFAEEHSIYGTASVY